MADDGNGRELWRGRIEARLASAEEDIGVIFRWKDSHEREAGEAKVAIFQRISVLETKVAGFAALGAAAGAVIAILVEWAFGGGFSR